MPQYQVPAINKSICEGWAEQDINLYNKLPFYLAKLQVEYRKTWPVWAKLGGKIPWSPNMGTIMKAVRKVPSPHLRQTAFPNAIQIAPKKDVIGVRETAVQTSLLLHRFESQYFNFLPSFQDFMTDGITYTMEDMSKKITRFEDIFIRSAAFHASPFVWLANKAGGENVDAPTGTGNDAGTDGKTNDWLAAQIPLIGAPGGLSLVQVFRAMSFLESDVRAPVFSGMGLPKDDVGPNGKFCLVLSAEAWGQFVFDPWVVENRPLDFDIVTDGFRGSLWGRITCKIEDLPLRIAVAANGDVSFPAPETIETNPNAYNFGETVPNPDYVAAQYEVAFLLGAEGFKSVTVGPPPKEFAGKGPSKEFAGMTWNGEVRMTDNIIIPCTDADGNITYESNKFGAYLQLIAQLTLGYLPSQRRNILPIIFKRVRGVAAQA